MTSRLRKDTETEIQKCKECDYKTHVSKYMVSHMLAHTGQYQCQQGCKEWFKTTKILDEHHRAKHTAVQEGTEFECEECGQLFSSRQYLSKHQSNRHVNCKLSCEMCGLIVRNVKDLGNHIKIFHYQNKEPVYQEVRMKPCHFYMNGECRKGINCRFSHDEVKKAARQNKYVDKPKCRNGKRCKYLLRGVCRYFHSKFESQDTQSNASNLKQNAYPPKQWCRFLEDCTRVPNCLYKHYDEVFPKLPNVNRPPWLNETTWKKY